jgi:hypothetical protein
VLVLEISKRVLGPEHPDTLTSMHNLAFIWNEQGRQAEGLKLIEECVLLRTRILGTGHPNTLDSRRTLLEWQADWLETGDLIDKSLDV